MKKIKILLISSLVLVFLSGCSFLSRKPQSTVFEAETVSSVKLNIPNPEPLSVNPSKWIVITSDNAEQVFDQLEKSGSEPVLIGLTDLEFQKLAISLAEIRNFINIQRMIIQQYKLYYEP